MLQERDAYDSAYLISLKALKIAEMKFTRSDTCFIDNLTQLGELCMETQRWDSSRLLHERARELNEKAFGKNNERNIRIIYGLTSYYFSMGRFTQATQLIKEQCEIVGAIYGQQSLNYAMAVNDLGVFTEDNGRFNESEANFKKAQEIIEKNYGTNNTAWILIIHNTADLYMMMGRYGESEVLFKTAIEKAEKIWKDSNIVDFPLYLNNLARLYLSTGRNEDAVPLFGRALQLYKETDNINMLSPLGNLASAWYLLGNINRADSLSLEASQLSDKMLGKDNMDYAAKIRLRANVMQGKNQWGEAEKLTREYLDVVKSIVGDHHYQYAIGLFNLACILEYKKDFQGAAGLFSQALELRKENEGPDHPVYARTLSRLAAEYFYLNQNSKAEPLFKENLRIHLQNIRHYFDFLSDSEREKYLAMLEPDFNRYKSFYASFCKTNPTSSSDLLNTILSTKGMLLTRSVKLRNAVVASGDTALLRSFNNWVDQKKEIGRYSMMNRMRLTTLGVNLDSLTRVANATEKEITQKVKISSEDTDIKTTDWTAMQKKLTRSDASVEFMHYKLYMKGRLTDTVMYAALVVRPGYAYPKLVPLFEERELRSVMEKMVNYRGVKVLDQPMSMDKSRDLYSMIWAPVDSLLKGVKNIYLSPSGLLHKISFAGLSSPDKKFLVDRYNLMFVSSGRMVGNEQMKFTGSLQPTIFGGINYSIELKRHAELTGVFEKSDNSQLMAFNDIPVTREIGRGSEWSFLQGTLIEASQVAKAFRDKKMKPQVLTGDSALEESFKSMSGNSPAIIHIATHGFYFSKKDGSKNASVQDNEFKIAADPLLRSGLVMAGGNRTWVGGSMPAGIDDGILTAYEVSLLDLSKTELVVLSACETGLGDINDSEGVYGLQRAFKMAGVRYIIYTLWEIRDEVTVEFMDVFYSQWMGGKEIHTAFRAAQEAMRAKYEANYWAAFVLSE
ncbi:MAG: CHAT domain-containing tetratricopeptide repeat protein [Bacteroidota bacterium]